MQYHVPTSSIPLLQDPPFVLWLVLLATAAGYRLLCLLRAELEGTTALERGVLSATLGLGLLQYLPLALGLTGALTPRAVWIGLVALSALLAPDMLHVLRGIGRAARRLAKTPPPAWAIVCVALLAIPLFFALIMALAPPTDNDGLAYHLTAPKRWLQWGRMAYLPTLIQTNAPMGVEMLYTLALAVWSDTAAKLIHFALGVLSVVAIFALGRRLGGVAAGFLSVGVFLFLPHVEPLRLFAIAYVDLGITLAVVCGALSWLLWRRVGGSGWLMASALCMGIGASFKLTGVFTGAVFAALTLWELRQQPDTARRAVRTALAFFGVSLLPLLPWLLRTALVTGDPVYPLLTGVFSTPDWSRQAGAAFAAYMRYYNGGIGQQGLTLAQRQMALIGTMAAIALVAGLAVRRARDADVRALAVAATAIAVLTLASTGLYQRFLIPVLGVAVPLICIAAARTRARAVGLASLIVLCGAITSFHLVRWNPPLSESLAVAAGRLDRDTYIDRALPIGTTWRYVNDHLPPDARILVAGFHPAFNVTSGISYYSDRYCFNTDAYFQQRIRLDTWEDFLSDLRRDRIEYVVAPERGEDHRLGPDYPPARNELPFTFRLTREYGRPLFSASGLGLYRLDRLPPEPPAASARASYGRSGGGVL